MSKPHESLANFAQITFAYVFIYAWSVCIIKYSIIALYRRIFIGMTWLAWWCVFLTTGYLITNHIVLPLYTKPLHYYWNQWYGAKGVVQVDEAKFYLGIGIINLFGDICILAVPVRNVLKLHMDKTQKGLVLFMFLLGSFVCFASLYRIVTIVRLTRTTDISWAKSDVFIWSSVEPSIGIISGCLPTLRPLLMHFLQRWFNYTPSTSSKSSGQKGHSSSGTKLKTLETISKKRTRKISKKDVLDETQFTQLDDEIGDRDADVSGSELRTSPRPHKRGNGSGTWRPDDDEMCLTTTTVQGRDRLGTGRIDEESIDSKDGSAIHVSKEFAWGEEKRQG
jgi:hypothetical protein